MTKNDYLSNRTALTIVISSVSKRQRCPNSPDEIPRWWAHRMNFLHRNGADNRSFRRMNIIKTGYVEDLPYTWGSSHGFEPRTFRSLKNQFPTEPTVGQNWKEFRGWMPRWVIQQKSGSVSSQWIWRRNPQLLEKQRLPVLHRVRGLLKFKGVSRLNALCGGLMGMGQLSSQWVYVWDTSRGFEFRSFRFRDQSRKEFWGWMPYVQWEWVNSASNGFMSAPLLVDSNPKLSSLETSSYQISQIFQVGNGVRGLDPMLWANWNTRFGVWLPHYDVVIVRGVCGDISWGWTQKCTNWNELKQTLRLKQLHSFEKLVISFQKSNFFLLGKLVPLHFLKLKIWSFH